MSEPFGPLLEVARIQSEINRLFNNLVDLGNRPEKESGAWIPNADILETEEALVVKVELPGVEPQDLQVLVNGGNLILQGEKRRPGIEGSSSFHAAERGFGSFRRVIQLGLPVNTRHADARLADGLLRILFPKVPNRRGEDVPIEVKSA